MRLVHPFGRPFTDEAGAAAVAQFTFEQEGTEVAGLLETALQLMELAAERGRARHSVGSGVQCHQLLFVISDGIMSEDGRERVRKWVRVAAERGQLLVLIIVDNPAGAGKDKKGRRSKAKGGSILETSRVRFGYAPATKAGSKRGAKGRKKVMKVTSYLEDYPFPYYIVVQDVHALPEALCDLMRQWFELIRSKTG